MSRLTPSDLERMPHELEKLMSETEMDIMIDIVDKIKKVGEITRSADYEIFRLFELGMNKNLIKKYIQKFLDLSEEELQIIFDEVIDKGYTYEKKLYKASGKEFIPYEKNESLKQYVQAVKEQTQGTFENITKTMRFCN